MYESLREHCDSFYLYIYAMDDGAAYMLGSLSLQHVTVISIDDINDPELLSLRHTRSHAEFCWTCESAIILHAMEKYQLQQCTYIDSDIHFRASPELLLAEMGDNSIMISPHRYSPEHEQIATCGRYCVQFNSFKNTPEGMRALKWWKAQCIKWCYRRFENGKFGGQKYLDDWLTRFDKVCELKHLGGGVAPWNVQQYNFKMKNGQLTGIEKPTGMEFPLVFYHYHALKFFTNGRKSLAAGYFLSPDVIKYIYVPYFEHLQDIGLRLTRQFGEAKYHNEELYPNLFRRGRRYMKRKARGALRRLGLIRRQDA